MLACPGTSWRRDARWRLDAASREMPPLAKARSPNVAGMRAAGLSPAGAIPNGIGMGTSDKPHNFFTTL